MNVRSRERECKGCNRPGGCDLGTAHPAPCGKAAREAPERVAKDFVSALHPDRGGKSLRGSNRETLGMQLARQGHFDEARDGRPARGDDRSRSVPARCERSDTASQAFQSVELLGEKRVSEVILAAQMLRQSLVIFFFMDYPFAENRVQRTNAERRGIQNAQQAIGWNPVPCDKRKFQGK